MRHVGLRERIEGDALPVAARQPAPDSLDPEAGDLEDREGKAEIGGLRHHRPAVREAPWRNGAQGLAVEANLALRRREFAGQDAQKRRLAGSVGADDDGEGAAYDGQIDGPDQHASAAAIGNTLRFQKRAHRAMPP